MQQKRRKWNQRQNRDGHRLQPVHQRPRPNRHQRQQRHRIPRVVPAVRRQLRHENRHALRVNAPYIKERRNRRQQHRPPRPPNQRGHHSSRPNHQPRHPDRQPRRFLEIFRREPPVAFPRIWHLSLNRRRRPRPPIKIQRIVEVPPVMRQPQHRPEARDNAEENRLRPPSSAARQRHETRHKRQQQPAFISSQARRAPRNRRSQERAPPARLPEPHREIQQREK